MSTAATSHGFPAAPPPEAIAELEVGAQALAALEASGTALALVSDADGVAVEICERGAPPRRISARELLDLLAPSR
ncbi:MAG TPA: hypothetical protein VNT58_09325 [Gaiellaceae bacterium]|nr:hypothetical protein [Gaiellaceae bacterium]